MFKLENNIKKYYWMILLSYQHFIGAILILYFLNFNYSIPQLILWGITFQFILASILEIPTGIFADKHSRKTSIILSILFVIVGVLLLLFIERKVNFILAMIFISFSHAFYSGAMQSWFYDSLKQLKKEKEYKKIEGKAQLIAQLGMAITTIIGAYSFQIHPKLPFILFFFVQIMWLMVAITIVEPKKSKKNQTYIVHLKHAIKYLFSKKNICYLFLLSLPVSVFYFSFMYVFNQLYFLQLSFTPVLIGILLVIIRIVIALGAYCASKINIPFRKEIIILLIIQAIFLILTVLTQKLYSVFFVIGLFFFYGIYSITLINKLHQLIKSEIRATLFSIYSLITNIAFGIGIFIFGIIVELTSVYWFFLISSLFFIITIISIFFLKNLK
jgi:MFS family permease